MGHRHALGCSQQQVIRNPCNNKETIRKTYYDMESLGYGNSKVLIFECSFSSLVTISKIQGFFHFSALSSLACHLRPSQLQIFAPALVSRPARQHLQARKADGSRPSKI